MRSSARSAVPALLTVLCLATSVFAQSAARHTAKTPRGTVSGRITIKDRAAPGVVVGVRKADPGTPFEPYSRAVTDEDGVYKITNLPPGNYQVTPFAPAYVVAGPETERAKTVVVGEDDDVEGINFSLVRGGVITGKVTDADGRPVIEQQVNIYVAEAFEAPQSPQQQPRSRFPMASNNTDDRGIYRVFGVAPGRYKVASGRSDEGYSGLTTSMTTYKQIFHPDVADPAKATTIEVKEGSEATNVDISLGRTLQIFSAGGRVIDESGSPVPNVRFGFSRIVGQRSEFSNIITTSNLRGDFIVQGLIPGKYGVYLLPNLNAEMRAETLTFDVIDQDVTNLTIKLGKGASISGVVIVESENKAARAQVLQMQLRAFVPNTSGFGQSTASNISPDGSFRMGGLPGGTVNLFLGTMMAGMPPKGFAISRIERDGISMQRVEIKEGEQVSGLKVFVSYGNATVRGVVTVENGPLPAGARVLVRLMKVGETSSNVRPGQVDSRGHFLMDGIPPGIYELTAFVVGNMRGTPPSAKREVNLADGAVTDVALIIDLAAPKP